MSPASYGVAIVFLGAGVAPGYFAIAVTFDLLRPHP